jgi:hypothetical protein
MLRGALEFAAAGVVPGGAFSLLSSTLLPQANAIDLHACMHASLSHVVLVSNNAGTKANLEYLAPVVTWAEGIGTVGKHLLVCAVHPPPPPSINVCVRSCRVWIVKRQAIRTASSTEVLTTVCFAV